MTAIYRITPKALSDLKNIGCYTMEKWGKPQRNRYLTDLDKRFNWLVKQPHLGKHRPDIAEGYYCFPQGSHLIFYMINPFGIDIIGIPHQSMDFAGYFNQ
ncbi:type II toxin-antitoxin system RelE/ParE family toxin [Methylicorpusculum sp.]|uniref:type II toxin-antitoxin system RelE/ParE family toxin n=1 Tax=Methylicorpusculum sp. TaxID=2713644 RepID=UPI0027198F78|nr:type II toxin-antitoxin system RelE/ParE family toxin [Methylicorpusculum sp.]MDO8843879.1 type II toxin-antitoxin system RelE/ParE family toxin [Methylicorpusculum sp.]